MDEDRLFYKLPVLKRMVIMLGGPTMNLADWRGVYCRADLWFWYGAGDE